jgi:cytochrome c oxidase cbb3-type subunit 3
MHNSLGYDVARGQRNAVGLTAALAVLGMTFGLSGLFQAKTVAERNQAQRDPAVSNAMTVAIVAEANPGYTLFEKNCAHCHGDDAQGDEGPNLHNLVKSDGRIATIINGGIKGEMPAFRKKFNEADIRALVSYLRTLVD